MGIFLVPYNSQKRDWQGQSLLLLSVKFAFLFNCNLSQDVEVVPRTVKDRLEEEEVNISQVFNGHLVLDSQGHGTNSIS